MNKSPIMEWPEVFYTGHSYCLSLFLICHVMNILLAMWKTQCFTVDHAGSIQVTTIVAAKVEEEEHKQRGCTALSE